MAVDGIACLKANFSTAWLGAKQISSSNDGFQTNNNECYINILVLHSAPDFNCDFQVTLVQRLYWGSDCKLHNKHTT